MREELLVSNPSKSTRDVPVWSPKWAVAGAPVAPNRSVDAISRIPSQRTHVCRGGKRLAHAVNIYLGIRRERRAGVLPECNVSFSNATTDVFSIVDDEPIPDAMA